MVSSRPTRRRSATQQPALGWRSRIVGEGDEAPDQLLANPANWRIHPKAQQDALAGVLDEVGWVQRVIVNQRTGHLVDGHLRVALALRQDAATVPVLYVDLDEAEEKLILATIDPVAALAVPDAEKLRALLDDVQTGSAAVQQMLADLADDAGCLDDKAGLTDPDAVPELRATDIVRGDLFQLGQHRLLCGDSTSAEDVARVMGGEKAALCLTDPPYGIGENYASHDDTPAELQRLIDGFFPLARSVSERVLLTSGNSNQRLYPKPDWTLCWFVSAGTGRNRWGFTCWQPVLAYGRDPYLAEGLGSRPDALAKTESADNSLGHPCPKPVGVWAWFVERGSAHDGDVVYEPFSGSGTTLIACEQLNRRCYAIEIEPAYVQVAIDRWEQFTGQKAVKL